MRFTIHDDSKYTKIQPRCKENKDNVCHRIFLVVHIFVIENHKICINVKEKMNAKRLKTNILHNGG